ncbi:MAG TPA: hypothetical protein ENG51_23850 [Deltaproteobacteria bacterium]|nr:hypothetical protein [Deltaproteobacteria bacterium]
MKHKLNHVLIFMAIGMILLVQVPEIIPKTSYASGEPEKETKIENTGSDESPILFPLEPLLVNLRDPNILRYLEVTFVLNLSSKKAKKEIEERLPVIKDKIINFLSTKTYDEAISQLGKVKIKKSVAKLINSDLTVGHIKKVFITKFIVQ